MKIGFDAKRAYHNRTGLGNYSRTLVSGLSTYFPEHEYFLFNPKPSSLYHPLSSRVKEVRPSGILEKRLPSFWRSSWVKKDLRKWKINLYHGLSNEIPVGIRHTGIPAAVTIHDLIFERYPEQFNTIDVKIYQRKYRYACQHANRIIAISKQTRDDIIHFYGVDEKKIDVCYQSCDPVFSRQMDEAFREKVRTAYQLPEKYFLSVGSVIERKNLLNICKALQENRNDFDIPLVVIGKGDEYLHEVKKYIRDHQLGRLVIFLSDRKDDPHFPLYNTETMAAIYQMAEALVYPSIFEGFGIPVLEALWSRIPVITSSTSCLPEAGGPGALYINPTRSDEIALAMKRLVRENELSKSLVEKGYAHAQNFSLENCTRELMKVYQKICPHG